MIDILTAWLKRWRRAQGEADVELLGYQPSHPASAEELANPPRTRPPRAWVATCHAPKCGLSRVEALRAPSGWQPIATAPQDGTDVLVWEPGNRCMTVAYYDRDAGEWMGDAGTVAPTHWHPLPAPPTP